MSIPFANPALLRRLRIGLFGGTFDPVHPGHLHLAQAARRACRLHAVWWLVSPGHWMKSPPQETIGDRIARIRRLTPDPAMVPTDLEAHLGTTSTWQTTQQLQTRFAGTRFVWIMGADNLSDLSRWIDWQRLAGTLPLFIAGRPGITHASLRGAAARRLAAKRLRKPAHLCHHQTPAWFMAPQHNQPHASRLLRGTPAR
ncbi:MAG: adenylyltransferase/cytidyltransferase family protein [Pseudomonadota bacterium]